MEVVLRFYEEVRAVEHFHQEEQDMVPAQLQV